MMSKNLRGEYQICDTRWVCVKAQDPLYDQIII